MERVPSTKSVLILLLVVSLAMSASAALPPDVGEYCKELYMNEETCPAYAARNYEFADLDNYYDLDDPTYTGSGGDCEIYRRCYFDPEALRIVGIQLEEAKLTREHRECTDACAISASEGGENYGDCANNCYLNIYGLNYGNQERDLNYASFTCARLLITSECCPEFPSSLKGCATAGPVEVSAEICGNTLDDDGDGKPDCMDDECATDASCIFKVTGFVRTGDGKPLAKVKVALDDLDDNDIVVGYTDASGGFTLDYSAQAQSLGVPEEAASAYLRVYLEDQDNQFQVFWDWQGANTGYSLTSAYFGLPADEVFDFTLKRNNPLFDEDSKIVNPNWDSHWDAGNTYYEAKRFFDFARTKLGYGFNGGGNQMPLPIYIYSDETTGAFYSPNHRGGGVFLGPWSSKHDNTECPENCIWHELLHFTMYNKYGAWSSYGSKGKNHEGFKNNNTGDSYEEGFAEFWPNILSLELDGDAEHIYAGVWNVELNYNPWVKEGKYEEFALASLLWDMCDSNKDKGEELSVPYRELWDVLMGQRLQSFKEVYDAIKAKWPAKSAEIDDLFVAHGIFKDTNQGNGRYDEGEPYWDEDPDGNGPLPPNGKRDANEEFIDIGTPDDGILRPHHVYTPGEEIGTASNYNRTTRTNKPLDRDSFVAVDVLSNGDFVNDAVFKVSYSFSDPSYNYVSYGVSQLGREVYVEIPPEEYGMTATITADSYEGGTAITVTPDEYYVAKAAGEPYITSAIISAGARKADYCNADGICQTAESPSCGDCTLPPLPKTVVQPPVTQPPAGQPTLPTQQTANQQASDNSAVGIVLALVLVLVIIIIAIVALVSRKKS